MDEELNIGKRNFQKLIETENLDKDRAGYVKALETAVRFLQSEAEDFRRKIAELKKSSVEPNEDCRIPDFGSCVSESQIVERWSEFASDLIEASETDLIDFSPSKGKIDFREQSLATPEFREQIESFADRGIIQWAADAAGTVYAPGFKAASEVSGSGFSLTPLKAGGDVFGLIVSKTYLFGEDFPKGFGEKLDLAAVTASAALQSVRSSEEIRKIGDRMKKINREMIEYSKYASIGKIAGALALEIKASVEIVRGHLDFLKLGLGDAERRYEIIETALGSLGEISSKLNDFASGEKDSAENVDLKNVIGETLSLVESRLKNDDVTAVVDTETGAFPVKGVFSQILQAILSVVLFSLEQMPEGGKMRLGLFERGTKNVVVVSDNSEGLTPEECAGIFDLDFADTPRSKMKTGLFVAKNIIESFSGTISAFSQENKGLTFKIYFPRL